MVGSNRSLFNSTRSWSKAAQVVRHSVPSLAATGDSANRSDANSEMLVTGLCVPFAAPTLSLHVISRNASLFICLLYKLQLKCHIEKK